VNCAEWLNYVRSVQAQAVNGGGAWAAQAAATANAARDERAARREARRQARQGE